MGVPIPGFGSGAVLARMARICLEVPMMPAARTNLAPGSRGFVAAIVAAQVLTQIGAFTLPALLPGYIDRWHLSKTAAGWLVGMFFAAYVPAVPLLLALTDRLPARRVYLLGTGLTALSHLGFALLADGFWSALLMRALAGIGWAGAYMPGLKAIADPLEGAAQSRAVSWHAAGVGIAGAVSFAVASLFDALAGPGAAFLFGAVAAATAFAIAATVMPAALPPRRRRPPARRAARLPPGVPQPRGRWPGSSATRCTPGSWRRCAPGASPSSPPPSPGSARRPGCPARRVLFTVAGLVGHRGVGHRQRDGAAHGRARVVLWAMRAAAALSLAAGWTAGSPCRSPPLSCWLWNAAIYLDSSALTAGTVQAATGSCAAPRWGCTACAATRAASSARSASGWRSTWRATACSAGGSPSAISPW